MNTIAHVLSMSTEMLYGAIASVCVVIALAIFMHDIRRGAANPHVWSWVVRMGIVAVAFTAQAVSGAKYSLALSGTQLVGGLLLLILIIRKQRKLGKLDTADISAIAVAICGVGVWLLSGHAIYAVIGTIAADLAATTMGVRAAFIKNTADSLAFWALCLFAAVMAVMSAHGQPLAVTLVPAASFINASINLVTILLVQFKQKQALLLENTEDDLA